MSLTLMYITNDPEVALIAEKSGVLRPWVDLETLGKEERQKGLNTVKSLHTISDISNISKRLTCSEMLVRVNPWNEGSEREIDEVIKAGAQLVMLPMWKTAEEVRSFIKAVNSRAKVVLLLETKEAVECLDEVLKISGIDEIHIGLNDLHLSMGLTFMFELLSNGTVEKICNKIAKTDIPYGFGGIAQLGGGDVPAELIVKEHYRLGSTRAILSRSFCDTGYVTDKAEIERIFTQNMKKLREFESTLSKLTPEEFEANRIELAKKIEEIVKRKKEACK